eukprot:TRINITY_DN24072_c0_g1_i1.p1 TRINITY_DN24072_c0_g1~~TRINITY_DN24072_c0_g1_i1.p1  ORF type:complete len:472 (-),score=20.35 TRINITY_DN24072_c0_g1_i1:80-1438(-)
MISDRKGSSDSRVVALPDECWMNVFTFLEATELSGSVGPVCSRSQRLSSQKDLWMSLLKSDFCASYSQRALLLTWMVMHQHFHPRQLYIFKRREHLLDLDIARAELQQRGEQAREQDRKQRRLRILNYILVRVTHLLLFVCLLASSVLLWLRQRKVLKLNFWVVFIPLFVFEAFLLGCALVTFLIYFQRSSSGWTFYWNRLQGSVRWLILYTSPCESITMLILAACMVPLTAAALEDETLPLAPRVVHMLHSTEFRFLAPFAAFWLIGLCFAWSIIRRRACSSGCIGSCFLLWLPLIAFSVLLYLRTSIVPDISPVCLFLPLILVTSVLILLASFLTVASFWLGWRGNRDWLEYASTTLIVVLTVLVPMLMLQFAVVGYLKGYLSTDHVFIPWMIWICGMLLFSIWQVFMPLKVSPTVPIDHLPRYWRQGQDLQSDTEMLLPPPTGRGGGAV